MLERETDPKRGKRTASFRPAFGAFSTNDSFFDRRGSATCLELGVKHRFTRPDRPQTNGKAERFIQTITREWAYGCCYRNSSERTKYLPFYLHDYNWHRPHTALYQNPPISRLRLSADNVSSLHSSPLFFMA